MHMAASQGSQVMQLEPLPHLQLVPLERCVLHEIVDPQRSTRLEARLIEDGLLRSPPIVVPYTASDRLLVLDGATRITTLRWLGFDAAPLQIVQYTDDRIKLRGWAHLLQRIGMPSLLQALRRIDGTTIEPVDVQTAQEGLRERMLLCALVAPGGIAWAVRGGRTLLEKARLLDDVFRCYAAQTMIHRLPDDELIDPAGLPNGTVVIYFVRYTKHELLELTSAGGILPAGMTRHIIPGRVLRLDVPLAALRNGTFETRHAWFEDWIAERIAAGHARVYAEPTWLLEE
jgi:hypothetical protein